LPNVAKSNHMQFILYSLLVPSTLLCSQLSTVNSALLSTLRSTIRCTLSLGPSSHFAYPFSSCLCLYQFIVLKGDYAVWFVTVCQPVLIRNTNPCFTVLSFKPLQFSCTLLPRMLNIPEEPVDTKIKSVTCSVIVLRYL
jgi:hypothetical protein